MFYNFIFEENRVFYNWVCMHIHSRDKSLSLNFCFIIGYLLYFNWNWLQWNRQWESHCYTTFISILYLHHIVYHWLSKTNTHYMNLLKLLAHFWSWSWPSLNKFYNWESKCIKLLHRLTILFFMWKIKLWILKGPFICMRKKIYPSHAVEPICLMKFVFHPNREIIIIITKKYQLI